MVYDSSSELALPMEIKLDFCNLYLKMSDIISHIKFQGDACYKFPSRPELV